MCDFGGSNLVRQLNFDKQASLDNFEQAPVVSDKVLLWESLTSLGNGGFLAYIDPPI